MIKKILKTFFVLFVSACFFLASASVIAQDDYSYDWRILEFESEANVLENSDVEITEKITVNFSYDRHGIYRTIPYRYYDRFGFSRNIFLKVLSVENEKGEDYKFEKNYSGGEMTIKIGDPGKTVVGNQTYLIKYRLSNVLNFFGDRAEFYFNVNGNDWQVPIDKISATVALPNDSVISNKKFFLGRYGDDDSSRVQIKNESPLSISAENLAAGEGLTYVVDWSEKITPRPKLTRLALWWFYSNSIFLFPVFLLIFLMYVLYKYGIDPKGRVTIAPEFSPPKDLSLLEIGIMIDEKADNHDFTAIIIDLAVNGFLKIKEIEKKKLIGKGSDFELIKIKDYTGPDSSKKKIMSGIFTGKNSVLLSSLAKEGKMSSVKSQIEKDAYSRLVKEKYFSRSPQLIKGIYYGVATLLIVLAFILPALLDRYFTFSATMISIAVSAVLLFIFAKYMPQRSRRGVLIKEQIEGFKLYLRTAEKYRMQFYEKTNYFEKFLPYAIALGVADIWAKKFENIYKKQPEWYEGNFRTFSVYSFTNNLNNQFSSSVKSAFTSVPASSGKSGFSSGGGFSGGGFGGGGGGSW
jgi:uncharacterized membrane protein